VKSWLVPARRAQESAAVRAVEGTPDQLVATGALVGGYGRDPVDGDVGYRPAGSAGRSVPYWTAERARTSSVAGYRSNPMARSIIDTYTSFCVGDKGCSLQVTNPDVRKVAEEFWNDPRNRLGDLQELMLRDKMIMGEQILELMTAEYSGSTRFSPIDPQSLSHVDLQHGNPLWPEKLWIRSNVDGSSLTEGRGLPIATVNDSTGLREGQAMFWAPWRTLLTDVRGMPFLTPVLDWLDSYDMVLSNLIDRTSLARYMVWDVTVQGGQDAVDQFVQRRGGLHVPPSGSVEVHNESVTWDAKNAQTGAFEDTAANSNVLTNIASGTGLAKHWLAEPDKTNRATSNSMAEPVRRRISGVQKTHLADLTELVRFAVDQAVSRGRLPRMVSATDPQTGETINIPAAMAVRVVGPEIAAADAEVNAQILLNLSTGLLQMVESGVLSPAAAKVAAKKGWEDYCGIPYEAALDSPKSNPDDLAQHIATAQTKLTAMTAKLVGPPPVPVTSPSQPQPVA
jgi:hypothetical protein